MSGSLKIDLKLDASGPLADGAAQKLVGDWTEATTQALGDAGVEMLRAVPMNKSGRSTGAFRSQLRTVRKSPTQVDVPGPSIKGQVWTPWLEGTSQRNQGSKFKGYHLFRKTRDELQCRAPGIAEAELQKYIGEMGGH